MNRLYHKSRHRFSDPRGTLLKIFEKPIGRVELIQQRTPSAIDQLIQQF